MKSGLRRVAGLGAAIAGSRAHARPGTVLVETVGESRAGTEGSQSSRLFPAVSGAHQITIIPKAYTRLQRAPTLP